jgi:hypothetical protein
MTFHTPETCSETSSDFRQRNFSVAVFLHSMWGNFSLSLCLAFWHGNGDGSGLDMNCHYDDVCLSSYGNQIINGGYGVHDTAKTCAVFNGPAPPTQFPAPSTTPAPECYSGSNRILH